MREEWRVVPFDTRYEVSNFGVVRSWAVNGSHNKEARQSAPVVVMTKACNRYGYPHVTINGKKLTVHFLMAACWDLGGQGPIVRHIDGNPKNNKLGNLVKGTQSENMRDAYQQGRLPHLRWKLARTLRGCVVSLDTQTDST